MGTVNPPLLKEEWLCGKGSSLAIKAQPWSENKDWKLRLPTCLLFACGKSSFFLPTCFSPSPWAHPHGFHMIPGVPCASSPAQEVWSLSRLPRCLNDTHTLYCSEIMLIFSIFAPLRPLNTIKLFLMGHFVSKTLSFPIFSRTNTWNYGQQNKFKISDPSRGHNKWCSQNCLPYLCC